MNQRTLEILEYARIRTQISGFCMSEEGQVALLQKEPSAQQNEIDDLKNLSRAWMRSISGETPPPFRGWPPVQPFLPRIRVEGASLSVEELHALGSFCESVCLLRDWADKRKNSVLSGRRDSLSVPDVSFNNRKQKSLPEDIPANLTSADSPLILAVLRITDLSVPMNEIFRVIDKSGEVRDLPELKSIRQNIKKIRQDIDRLVGSYLSDDSLKNTLQSTLPTIRDGRQVISVRSNFRGRIKGIVHEVSQSGQTVYIEPEDVVDRNNDLVTEEHRYTREVARILKELTSRLAPFYDAISESLDTMIFLDGIGASARWGCEYRCIFAEAVQQTAVSIPESEPKTENALSLDVTNPDSPLQLRQARHPLLGNRAVPIDLVLTPGGRILIITGPNTGGKTVTLKTVALFALLNQTGWPIPAAEPTVLPVFDYIGCDIGDEQSLDQSLSTFSGHMKNIAEILTAATENSLILLDELGSGTDPQEGSAIAMAVLDSLLAKKALVLVTTHHGILKNYGYTHESCINASVDFDQDTLQPTYRILMGIPGESHALDIARRNGLAPSVVEQARSYLLEERADVSALIKGLTAKHEELAQIEKEKKTEERYLKEKRRKADLKELQLRQKELELRAQGYRRLDDLLANGRKQLENLVRELREGEITREKTLQVKAWCTDFESQVSAEHAGLAEEQKNLDEMCRAFTESEQQNEATSQQNSPGKINRKQRRHSAQNTLDQVSAKQFVAGQKFGRDTPDIAPGVEVYLGTTKRRAVVIREAKKGNWIVAAGTLKMTVPGTDLSVVPKSGSEQTPVVEIHTEMDSSEVPVYELRLLGMRHDEAVKALERQLDLAAMNGLGEFIVIHGKGHGVLQEAVRQKLGTSGVVKEFHFARPEDGGTGKTIVTLI